MAKISEQFATLDAQTNDNLNKYVDTYDDKVEELVSTYVKHTPQKELKPIVFEKDDPTNGHIAFLTAFANCRALNYNIIPASIDEIRRIAGNIIPAMITTTAAIVGHVCIEYVKLVRKMDKIEDYKQVFMNFALPLL